MLHSALARALATAHVEDQLRAAAHWRTIRLARRARATREGDSNRRTAIRVDSTESTAPAPADVMTPTEIPQAALWPCQSVVDVRSGPRAGIDRASSRERPASSFTRTSRGSE
jgi:hypothetical protein